MQQQALLIKYLGCPLFAERQKISYYSEMINKVTSRVRGWHARLLSLGGKVVLIKHVLLSMPMHLISTLQPPKGVLVQIERILSKFVWSSANGTDRHHWTSWSNLCYPYFEGGANFRSLHDICKAFSAKIWWNLRTNNSLWRDFMMSKYCRRIHPLAKQPRYMSIS